MRSVLPEQSINVITNITGNPNFSDCAANDIKKSKKGAAGK